MAAVFLRTCPVALSQLLWSLGAVWGWELIKCVCIAPCGKTGLGCVVLGTHSAARSQLTVVPRNHCISVRTATWGFSPGSEMPSRLLLCPHIPCTVHPSYWPSLQNREQMHYHLQPRCRCPSQGPRCCHLRCCKALTWCPHFSLWPQGQRRGRGMETKSPHPLCAALLVSPTRTSHRTWRKSSNPTMAW